LLFYNIIISIGYGSTSGFIERHDHRLSEQDSTRSFAKKGTIAMPKYEYKFSFVKTKIYYPSFVCSFVYYLVATFIRRVATDPIIAPAAMKTTGLGSDFEDDPI